MSQTEAAVVRKQIVVDAPIESAFTAFTDRFGDFKPPEHNLLGAPIAETVFEHRIGGNIFDRAADGSECRWARILAFDPPDRVVLSWDISPQWTIETDQAQTSRGALLCRVADPHASRARAPAPRPARSRLGSGRRRCRRRGGLATVPRPFRRADQPWPIAMLTSHAAEG